MKKVIGEKKEVNINKMVNINKVVKINKVVNINKLESINKVVNKIRERCFDGLQRRYLFIKLKVESDRGDVPGWVLVVLMTTGLVTGIWTLAAPRIDSILRNSLDSMNSIR